MQKTELIAIVEQTVKILLIVLSIYELPWENYLAIVEVFIIVFTTALPCRTLSTCRSGNPILGSEHIQLYPLDTSQTAIWTLAVILWLTNWPPK